MHLEALVQKQAKGFGLEPLAIVEARRLLARCYADSNHIKEAVRQLVLASAESEQLRFFWLRDRIMALKQSLEERDSRLLSLSDSPLDCGLRESPSMLLQRGADPAAGRQREA